MAYYITEECVGCMACLTNCPVDAITGDRKMLHIIDPDICIDCSACGMVCPVEAIHDQNGDVAKFIKRPRIARSLSSTRSSALAVISVSTSVRGIA